LKTTLLKGDQEEIELKNVILPTNAVFRVNAFSISSYSDHGQDPRFAGSILASGKIDNISVVHPGQDLLFSGVLTNQQFQAEIHAEQGFRYALEKSENLKDWIELDFQNSMMAGAVLLQDLEATGNRAFYRIQRSELEP
jgi:hypothetical protein